MKTITIHGREYVPVASRVQMAHEAGLQSITTELVHYDGERVVVRAVVTLADGRTFTGYAEEVRGSEGIAGKSPVEVAETSAVGRALGFAGFGSTDSIASADEVQAKSNGNGRVKDPSAPATEKQIRYIRRLLSELGFEADEEQEQAMAAAGFPGFDLTRAQASEAIERLKAKAAEMA